MKALCLFGVFALAKLLVLAGRDVPLSPWTPTAYLWQDVLVVLLFAGFDHLVRNRVWAAWVVYGLLAGYTALNVPLECVLSTPLTWPILRATSGALADSIAHHVTLPNLLRLTAVLAAAAVLPLLARRFRIAVPARLRYSALGLALLVVVLGPVATARVETWGLHRNVLAVLVTTALPRIPASDVVEDWRQSPFGAASAEDLSRYRGVAAGRNVVVVHLESTAARYLGLYGAPEDPMPNLSRLAREGIVFGHAYTVYPETIKTFFTVQCSRYPALDVPTERYEHVGRAPLAGVLAAAGYATGLFHSGRFGYLGMEAVVRGRGYQTLEDAAAIGGEHASSFGIDEPSTVRRILEWIDGLPPGRPFFVTYLPIAGHHPYETPGGGPFPEVEEIDRYRNALHYADEALGQFREGLRQRGREGNTLFVLFGDHGEAFGQHAGNYGHTLFLYEENVRVPYVVAAPGLFTEPMRVHRLASLVDTAPTVLDLLGLPLPEDYQGTSLLTGWEGMALFCTDYSLGFVGLRDGRWKLIHQLESGRSQLFDLESDPDERRDVAGEFAGRAAAYREHLLRWSAAQKYLLTR